MTYLTKVPLKSNYYIIVILILNFYLIISCSLSAQSWEYILDEYAGNSKGNAVIELQDGDFMVLGDQDCKDTLGVDCKAALLKLNKNGLKQDYFALATSNPTTGIDLLELGNGNLLVLMLSTVNEQSVLMLAEVDNSGEILEEKTLVNRIYTGASNLLGAEDGGYFITGHYQPFDTSMYTDPFLLKLSENWEEEFFSTEILSIPDFFISIEIEDAIILNNGDVFLAGSRYFFLGGAASATAAYRFNNLGELVWKAGFSTTEGSTTVNSILEFTDDVVILVGDLANGEQNFVYAVNSEKDNFDLIAKIESINGQRADAFLFPKSDSSMLLFQEDKNMPVVRELRQDGFLMDLKTINSIPFYQDRKFIGSLSPKNGGGMLTGYAVDDNGFQHIEVLRFDSEGTVGVFNSSINDNNGFVIYPNPVRSNKLFLSFGNENSKASNIFNSGNNWALKIFNANGEVLIYKKIRSAEDVVIDVEKIGNGVFFVELTNEEGRSMAGKFIVKR